MWMLHIGARNKMKFSIPVLALLLLLTLKGVSSISCFQCNSHIDPQCLELQKNNTSSPFYRPCEIDSEIKKTFCRKIDLHIVTTGERRVVRTCSWEVHPSLECYKNEDDDHWEKVCQCFTDGCNAASLTTNSKKLFTAFTLVISLITAKLLVSQHCCIHSYAN